MGNLIIQIASLASLFPKRRKNIFNINAHIYKGLNKWMKFMYMWSGEVHVWELNRRGEGIFRGLLEDLVTVDEFFGKFWCF
jgi:hypothetical protein